MTSSAPTLTREPLQTALPPQPQPPPQSLAPARVVSVDALRGFIMFWICGGDYLFASLAKASPGGFFQFIAGQLTHQQWQGVVFYDLIFPLFIFIVGVSLVFSLNRSLQEHGRSATIRHIILRSLVLYLLGVFLYGGISKGIENVRWLGVLQRIGLCYLFTGIAFSFLRVRGLVTIFVVILVGYWAALTFIPIRNISLEKQQLKLAYMQAGHTDAARLFAEKQEYVSGKYDDGLNVANHFDFQYLPGKKWDGAYDPEGFLSTAPAIATCLFGVFAGLLLRSTQIAPRRKTLILFGAGLASLILGELWGMQFPVIKKIWTSSYVLVAGGFSCLFLGAFYQIIEIWDRKSWALFFRWFGMNSIAIYVIVHVVEFRSLAERLVGASVRERLGPVEPLLTAGELWKNALVAAVAMVLVTLVVRGLYQRKIFFKL